MVIVSSSPSPVKDVGVGVSERKGGPHNSGPLLPGHQSRRILAQTKAHGLQPTSSHRHSKNKYPAVRRPTFAVLIIALVLDGTACAHQLLKVAVVGLLVAGKRDEAAIKVHVDSRGHIPAHADADGTLQGGVGDGHLVTGDQAERVEERPVVLCAAAAPHAQARTPGE